MNSPYTMEHWMTFSLELVYIAPTLWLGKFTTVFQAEVLAINKSTNIADENEVLENKVEISKAVQLSTRTFQWSESHLATEAFRNFRK